MKVLKPGGAIFLGDIRNYVLLEPFLASVVIHDAPDALATGTLKEQFRKALAEEQELTIDPNFFKAIAKHLPQIAEARN